jgi:hypothetical protein
MAFEFPKGAVISINGKPIGVVENWTPVSEQTYPHCVELGPSPYVVPANGYSIEITRSVVWSDSLNAIFGPPGGNDDQPHPVLGDSEDSD